MSIAGFKEGAVQPTGHDQGIGCAEVSCGRLAELFIFIVGCLFYLNVLKCRLVVSCWSLLLKSPVEVSCWSLLLKSPVEISYGRVCVLKVLPQKLQIFNTVHIPTNISFLEVSHGRLCVYISVYCICFLYIFYIFILIYIFVLLYTLYIFNM